MAARTTVPIHGSEQKGLFNWLSFFEGYRKQSAKDDCIAKGYLVANNEQHFEDWVDELVGFVNRAAHKIDEESMIEVLWAQIPPAKRHLAKVD
ncbi:hypothetical protein GNI_056200 [Gregarina niphandrodes]|uniref:Uncharacterized protein n=1 Tax=Gregarina niphandrodes TaxID=110365 RepID=A0A023B8R6_GRENI|nr:hypothetical protein GNI_056200 [Gregarina niphandrodes]EZG70297.1 hypothetical protein GNI_056200 [Gregarina niphandrodes]|eukprot:XP_011129959.1 hypothetical protein GNI_056200 [Gregarina niphandrodes]